MSYKDNLKPLDIIIVYNRKSWLHRLIYGFTKYKAGHCAIYLGKDQIVEACSTGIKKHKTKNYNSKCKIMIARVKNLPGVQGYLIFLYCNEQIGKKYAFGQLAIMVLKYIFKLKHTPDISKKAMICSEFVQNAFLAGDINISGLPAHETTPGHIMSSDKVELEVF